MLGWDLLTGSLNLADVCWCLYFCTYLWYFFFPDNPHTGQTRGHGSLHGEETPSLHWRIASRWKCLLSCHTVCKVSISSEHWPLFDAALCDTWVKLSFKDDAKLELKSKLPPPPSLWECTFFISKLENRTQLWHGTIRSNIQYSIIIYPRSYLKSNGNLKTCIYTVIVSSLTLNINIRSERQKKKNFWNLCLIKSDNQPKTRACLTTHNWLIEDTLFKKYIIIIVSSKLSNQVKVLNS